jgi:dienelactone hydrolase
MSKRGNSRVVERVVELASSDARLVGIFAEPARISASRGVLLVQGGGVPAPNHARAWVTLARRLAEGTLRTLRFDYHGVGESDGVVDDFDLSIPFIDDIVAAARAHSDAGSSELYIIGSCFGGRCALAAAATGQLPTLRGVLLIDLPFAVAGLGRAATRNPVPDMIREMDQVLRAGITVTLVVGTLDASYESLTVDVMEMLAPFSDRGFSTVYMDNVAFHGLPSRESVESLHSAVADWLNGFPKAF